MLTKTEAAQKLLALEDVLILCHRNPDGDTLGSGFALARALLNKGRRARVFCHDAVPEKFAYMVPEMPDFEPKTVISVDVADFALFGERTEAQIARVRAGGAGHRPPPLPPAVRGRTLPRGGQRLLLRDHLGAVKRAEGRVGSWMPPSPAAFTPA